ncbi:MAG: hypothetical protein HQL58_06565 [Magnetococcales bacterium]|nr:hypothetical protein [Magnetococcales bacterium]
MQQRSLWIALGSNALLAVVPIQSGQASSQWYTTPFMAEMVMTDSSNPAQQATVRVHVDATRFRAEGSHNGVTKVVLGDRGSKQLWTIMPEQRRYHKGIAGPVPPEPDIDKLPGDPDSPCTAKQAAGQTAAMTAPKTSCNRLGQEVLHGGVMTDQWDIQVHYPNQPPLRMTLWADPSRHVILRQKAENGPTMERRLIGYETIHGREAERWEISQSFQNKTQSYTQWVDKQLRLPVRTTGQQPFRFEVTSIQEGVQPEQLFQLPEGFQEVAAPQPPAAATGQGK